MSKLSWETVFDGEYPSPFRDRSKKTKIYEFRMSNGDIGEKYMITNRRVITNYEAIVAGIREKLINSNDWQYNANKDSWECMVNSKDLEYIDINEENENLKKIIDILEKDNKKLKQKLFDLTKTTKGIF